MLESHPLSAGADRNLLFGILALQMDFINRDALIAAMNAWVLDKAKPLGQILLEQNQLGRDRLLLLDAMVGEHVKAHGGDAQRSMAALSAVSWIRKALADVADPDVDASIACLPGRDDADPYATRNTIGTSTATGVRYRILRPHAKGNLGEVFVAQDVELHREVALKEIQAYHADHPETRARFILEAEITGGLEHPGIVPVYGLGTYADGRPYYAMRFIKGDNLREAIDRFHERDVAGRDPRERRLSYLQLLRRFIDVCNAVAYAHARGILHRDLKPGNIMLGKYGETLVVDWGLAKPVGRSDLAMRIDERSLQPSAGSSGAVTLAGMVVGTPAYMSPEQAGGRLDELGAASDVYSLGATLYSLLTGKSPVLGENAAEVLHKVQRGEITPPRQAKKETPAALEAVCLKAMAFKPEERYKSALALAADVEHWLADEPVAAYRERRWERGRRWLRRHRTLATSAAATLMVAVLLLSGAAVLLNDARQDEKQARTEAEKQVKQRAAVADLLVRWFRGPDPSVDGPDVKVVDVLEDALIDVERGAIDDDATTALLVDALGETFLGLGLSKKAIPLHDRARRLRIQALGPDHPDTLGSMNNLALAYLADGKSAEALQLFKETLELRKATLGTDHPDTLVSMSGLASAYEADGQFAKALSLFEETLERRKATLGSGHRDTVVSVNELALAYQARRRLNEALPLFEETLTLSKVIHGPDHPYTLVYMNNLAGAYQDGRRFAEALSLYEETRNLKNAKLGADHPSTLASVNNLAAAYQDGGRLNEALALYESTLELSKAKLGPGHHRTLGTMNNLASAYFAGARLTEAQRLFEDTLKLMKVRPGPDHPNTLMTMCSLARAYEDGGRLTDAVPLYEETLNLTKATLGPDDPDTLLTMTGLGRCLLRLGKLEQAALHLREAVSFYEKKQPDDVRRFTVQSLLGAALAGQNKFAEAETLLLAGYEGLSKREAKLPPSVNRELPDALDRIVQLYNAWEKPDKAAEWRTKREELKQAAERMKRLGLAVWMIAGWPVAR